MDKTEGRRKPKEVARTHNDPEEFDLDTISWLTERVAITSAPPAEVALMLEDHFVINVAEEVFNYAHAHIPLNFSSWDLDRQRQTVELVGGVIQGVLHYTDHKVVVHCQRGMEPSVLAIACWLRTHKDMSLNEVKVQGRHPFGGECNEECDPRIGRHAFASTLS